MSNFIKLYRLLLDRIYVISNGKSGIRYHVCPICEQKFHRWSKTDSINDKAVCSIPCAYRLVYNI